MSLFKLSLVESIRNIRQSLFLSLMVVLILSFSISVFITSIEIVIAMDSGNLKYKNPKQLKYIQIKDLSRKPLFDSKEIHISQKIIRHFIQAYNNPNLAYSLIQLNKVSINNNHELLDYRVDLVSSNFFKVLGVSPFKGQFPDYKKNEIALSYNAWKDLYKQKTVIGKIVHINKIDYTISAILPENYRTPSSYQTDKFLQQTSQFWIPIKDEIAMFTTDSNHMANLFVRSTVSRTKLNQDLRQIHLKIKDLDKQGRPFIIESGNLSKSIYGADSNKSSQLLYFSIFLLTLTLLSVLILLSTKTKNTAQQIAMKRMLGASFSASGMTQKLEYLILTFGISFLTIPLIFGFKIWLIKLDFLDVLSHQDINAYLKVLISFVVLALLYLILILMPKLKLSKTQLITAVKGHFNKNQTNHFIGHKALLFLQSIVAVVLLFLSFTLVLDTFANYRNLNRIDMENKVSLQLEITNGEKAQIYAKATELKQKIKKLSWVKESAISTASPLSLQGMPMQISQSYQDPTAVESMGKNSFKVLKPEAKAKDLKMSIIYVEPQYFELLGIHFLQGKTFSENNNEVILINEQLPNIFGEKAKKPEIAQYIPASPTFPLWKLGIVLGGVINNIGVFDNELVSVIFKSFNLAFRLLNASTAKNIDFKNVSIIFSAQNIPKKYELQIKNITKDYSHYFHVKSLYKLPEEANKIIAKSSIKTLSALFLSLFSLLLIVFGSIGLVNSICIKMYKEIGIRLAIGATDGSIVKMILLKILMPSFLGVISSLVIIITISLFLGLHSLATLLTFIPIVLILVIVILIAILIPLRKLIKGTVSDFISVVE